MVKYLNSKGYSMFEMLLVLLILSVLASLIIPNLMSVNQSLEANHFFKQLETDLYEAQMRAMTNGYPIRVIFSQSNKQYTVRRGVVTIKVRKIPDNMNVRGGTLRLDDVQYRTDGTLSRTGTIHFTHRDDTYELRFHFIRGRFTIAKR
ncbi:competence type IV pilus minor pilin ComGD [Evansella halocellulosilytica]|uniref:competence type IV pilus minor pilin ComGD n=1 Tax=Evansella halocellulosilytica TaxID=2011013 RepID=UPI00211CD293|nr:competence type IV pilus minor pilin ComGD [Evansella halocellulosilytica]